MERKLLSLAILTSLIGCGGGSGGGGSSSTFSITAIDGYLQNAAVSVDTTGDGVCDLSLGKTDAGGTISVANQFQSNQICINAVAGQTIDTTRGTITSAFELKAPAGSSVVTPLTNLVVDLMAADSTLTEETAKQSVVTLLESAGFTGTTSSNVFGDFLASGGLLGAQLEIISKTLVDNSGVSNAIQTAIISQVATVVSSAQTETALDNVEIVIAVDGSGNVMAEQNSRPVATGGLRDLTVNLGDSIGPIELASLFEDADGDPLTYSVIGDIASVDGSVLTLTTNLAGDFDIEVYAIDDKGTHSYPISFEVDVDTDNSSPTVSDSVETQLNTTAATWSFSANQAVDETLDLTGLFSDQDGDDLTLSATTDATGILLNIDGLELMITGTPLQSGSFEIDITASDGIHADGADASIDFDVAASTASASVIFQLMGQTIENSGSNSFNQQTGNWDSISEHSSASDQFSAEVMGSTCMATNTYSVSAELENGVPTLESLDLENFTCDFSEDATIVNLTDGYDNGDHSGTVHMVGVRQGSGFTDASLNGDYVFTGQYVENAGSTSFNQDGSVASVSGPVGIVEMGTVTFDGNGGCSATLDYVLDSDLRDNGSGTKVPTLTQGTDSFTCPAFTVSDDGQFAIDTAQFVIAADKRLIVGRNAYHEAAETYSGTQHAFMMKKASNISLSSISGTYHVTAQYAEIYGQTTANYSELAGSLSIVEEGTFTFDGAGGCSYTLNEKLSELDTNGNPSLTTDTPSGSCTYSMLDNDIFTIDGARFAISKDGSVIIGVGGYDEENYTGVHHTIMIKQ